MHDTRLRAPRLPPPQTAVHPMWGPGDAYLVAAKLRNSYWAEARSPNTLVAHVPPPLATLLVDIQAALNESTTAPKGPATVRP